MSRPPLSVSVVPTASPSSLHILLIEQRILWRDALAALIRHGLPHVSLAVAGSVAEARATLRRCSTVALICLGSQVCEAPEPGSLRELRAEWPTLPILVLAGDGPLPEGDHAQAEAPCLDTLAFLPGHEGGEALVARLRSLLDEAPQRGATGRPEPLTFSERQRDVLRLLMAGRPNKQIAHQLGLSEPTVKTHLQAAFRKLGVTTRTQAALALRKLGWE